MDTHTIAKRELRGFKMNKGSSLKIQRVGKDMLTVANEDICVEKASIMACTSILRV